MSNGKVKFLECLIGLWPKILFKKQRQRIRNGLRRVSVQQRKEAEKKGYSPTIQPWAFIRVKNERKMLKASLDSILTVFDRGVIAYNECTDGSDEIIEEFCRENKGFIPYCYPYAVEPAGSKKYATGELKEENTLSGYYNAVMDKIPKGVWVMKIDVDHIYLKEALRYSFTLPKKRKDIVIYSKLNCVRDSRGKIKVFSYVRPGDQWLLYNDNLRFKMNCGFDDFGNFFAYEHLSLKGRNVPYMPECPSVHFPFEKNSRSFKGKIEELVDIDEYIRDADGFEISDDLLMVKEVMRKIEL